MKQSQRMTDKMRQKLSNILISDTGESLYEYLKEITDNGVILDEEYSSRADILRALCYADALSDSIIASLFNLTTNQISYRRRKHDILKEGVHSIMGQMDSQQGINRLLKE